MEESWLDWINRLCQAAQDNPPPEAPDNPAEDLDRKMQAVSGQAEQEVHLSVLNIHW
jgi:hypothetical protein